MRRLPFAVFIATLAVPASAEAGTLALEGTELVYRASPGAEDVFAARQEAGRLTFEGLEGSTPDLTPGTGCERAGRTVRCSLAQVTAVRVLAGDGDDLSLRPDGLAQRRRQPLRDVVLF